MSEPPNKKRPASKMYDDPDSESDNDNQNPIVPFVGPQRILTARQASRPPPQLDVAGELSGAVEHINVVLNGFTRQQIANNTPVIDIVDRLNDILSHVGMSIEQGMGANVALAQNFDAAQRQAEAERQIAERNRNSQQRISGVLLSLGELFNGPGFQSLSPENQEYILTALPRLASDSVTHLAAVQEGTEEAMITRQNISMAFNGFIRALGMLITDVRQNSAEYARRILTAVLAVVLGASYLTDGPNLGPEAGVTGILIRAARIVHPYLRNARDFSAGSTVIYILLQQAGIQVDLQELGQQCANVGISFGRTGSTTASQCISTARQVSGLLINQIGRLSRDVYQSVGNLTGRIGQRLAAASSSAAAAASNALAPEGLDNFTFSSSGSSIADTLVTRQSVAAVPQIRDANGLLVLGVDDPNAIVIPQDVPGTPSISSEGLYDGLSQNSTSTINSDHMSTGTVTHESSQENPDRISTGTISRESSRSSSPTGSESGFGLNSLFERGGKIRRTRKRYKRKQRKTKRHQKGGRRTRRARRSRRTNRRR